MTVFLNRSRRPLQKQKPLESPPNHRARKRSGGRRRQQSYDIRSLAYFGRDRIFPFMATLFIISLQSIETIGVFGYHRTPCKTSSVRRQFQFSDCYVPNLNPSLFLNEASFVMSHDSATGYLMLPASRSSDHSESVAYFDDDAITLGDNNAASYHTVSNVNQNTPRWNAITTALLSFYGKTQTGSVYDQLNDGARALDLRPKIYNNGTVGFHHGSLIDIPLSSVTLGGLLEDAKQWCKDNPKELVLIFHSELVHEAGYNGLSSQVYLEVGKDDDNSYGDDDMADDGQQIYEYFYSGIATLRQIYQQHGVPYYPCSKVGNFTVGEAMELADMSKQGGKGYLLALDRHDMYSSFCGKSNWVQSQLVTCYHPPSNNDDVNQNSAADNTQGYIQCTDRKNTGISALNALKTYVTSSTNNEPTDSEYKLGPPKDESYYPFNEIQGFWQVDALSVQIGLMHASTLLEDNRISQVNAEMVTMAYESQFDSISLFTLDNVALNGNAMFSVLRNSCGQSVVNEDSDEHACGNDLVMPQMMTSRTLPIFWNIVLIVIYGALVATLVIMLAQAFRLRNKGPQDHRLICNGHVV